MIALAAASVILFAFSGYCFGIAWIGGASSEAPADAVARESGEDA